MDLKDARDAREANTPIKNMEAHTNCNVIAPWIHPKRVSNDILIKENWDSNSGPLDREPTALRGGLLLNLICLPDGQIKKSCDAVVVAMIESRCYTDSPVLAEHQPFNRNGKALRGSKKSVLFYTTDCGDEKEDLGLKLQQRSVSLVSPAY
ncbi:uncharacterized protein [Temnothorax nylanderi]|uniref:uncharacterized protein n=1 Tax=Temnothorax nylanderi TaxID=102681 RepID=UPI003A89EAA1